MGRILSLLCIGCTGGGTTGTYTALVQKRIFERNKAHLVPTDGSRMPEELSFIQLNHPRFENRKGPNLTTLILYPVSIGQTINGFKKKKKNEDKRTKSNETDKKY